MDKKPKNGEKGSLVNAVLTKGGYNVTIETAESEGVAMDKKPKNGEKGSLVNAVLTKGGYNVTIETAESGNAVDDIIDELPEF
ncbi:hypothetical protein Glove_232g158 [Diversispora epigaea]|uniref:Uncharacterized protein n=1 Tax=Diversispora epigaea TaxID=1348612 RepID=A0A397IEN2_9GLOM|nr:hypothetical protein Glove_232g158 [Diversispora epigaea]